jgi:hypothetical protein
VIMKLIGCDATDLQGLGCAPKVYKPFAPCAGDTQPQEPIHVQVRIRQYAEALPELRRTLARRPNTGRLPVGTMLDCYL